MDYLSVMGSNRPYVQVDEFAPGNFFPYGWLSVALRTRDTKASMEVALSVTDAKLPDCLAEFRAKLLTLEESFADGIEAVRRVLERLPAEGSPSVDEVA